LEKIDEERTNEEKTAKERHAYWEVFSQPVQDPADLNKIPLKGCFRGSKDNPLKTESRQGGRGSGDPA